MKSKNILTVINNFKKIVHLAPNKENLNMIEGGERENACGTVCCHGGWYCIAVKGKSNSYMTFLQGADFMAQTLGFAEKDGLKHWTSRNMELWGNNRGFGIFCIKSAFYHPVKRPNGAETLQDIIDHWEEVYERVKAIEISEHKDVRAELTNIIPIVNESPDVINNKILTT